MMVEQIDDQLLWFREMVATAKEWEAFGPAEIECLNGVVAIFGDIFTLRPASEYRQEMGPVLWWHPNRSPDNREDFHGAGFGFGPDQCATGDYTYTTFLVKEGFYTHFSKLPDPRLMRTADGKAVKP
jgi:hypothetical protein